MAIKIECFGGGLGWRFKKRFPRIASEAYIRANLLLRRKATKRYIEWFLGQGTIPKPQIVSIETINRCNSTCSFCPANKNNDKRPYVKMSDAMFFKIIRDLKDWGYKGFVSLYVNNEPFIDSRIVEFHRHVKQELPECRVKFFTNGLLMGLKEFLAIIPYVDYMVINNYGKTMELHENIRTIYEYVTTHEGEFQEKTIWINIRYIDDVLTNRAGEAPNKKGGDRIVREPCLFPYTDLTIFSNGNTGICCNDATEKTNLGNVMERSLRSIWEDDSGSGVSYPSIRENMRKSRSDWEFCRNCDTLDTGLRVRMGAGVVKNEKK